MRADRAGTLAFAVALSAGCAHRAGPADALGAYASAIERKDYAAAYALMSSSFRERVSLAEFRASNEREAAELQGEAKALRANAERLASRLEVAVAPDERVALVRESGAWRLEGPPFDPYGQATPRAALRSFVRAVENRRHDVLARLAPARFRAAITPARLVAYWEGEGSAEHRALLRELRLHLDAPIALEGDEAFMTYGNNRQVRFVREEGLWRIESPE